MMLSYVSCSVSIAFDQTEYNILEISAYFRWANQR